MSESMIRLSVTLGVEAEPLAEQWLWDQGAQAITTADVGKKRRLEALFHQTGHEDLSSAFGDWLAQMSIDNGSLACEPVDTSAWRVARRNAFQTTRVGRIWLISELDHDPPEPGPDELALTIYPDQAFGSGDHATTRLMLLAMQAWTWTGKKVLDVGSGTGILAILAEKMGAATCHGFDIDPTCEEDMRHHRQINGCRHTEFWIGPPASVGRGGYDWILANVTLNVHRDLMAHLPQWAAPNARVLGSGITQAQWHETQNCYGALGWALTEVSVADEWVCFEGRPA